MFINLLLLLFILLRGVIGGRLLRLARQNTLPNIYWLAAQFLLVAIATMFAPAVSNPLGDVPISLWMFTGLGSIMALALLLAFNHSTFYQGRKSPLRWYAGMGAIVTLITLYGLIHSESNYAQHPCVAFMTFGLMPAWFWHGWCAYQALAGLAAERVVEDWIKARYRLIMLYSVVFLIGQIASFVRIFYAGGSDLTPLGYAMGLLTLFAQITAISLCFLVWVMPEGFRRWLNRNQQVHTEEQTREQALAILDILSSAMVVGTGLPRLVALFMIRKAVGRMIDSDDSHKIEACVIAFGYNEWLDFLDNSELYRLIGNSSVVIDPRDVIAKARRALIEKQSLFTMRAK